MNAAVWFGAAVFFTVGAEPALFSKETQALLGEQNYPYFSRAMAHILSGSYFKLHLACGIVALLHLTAEWLYLGRPVRRFSLALLAGLLSLALLSGLWLHPRLNEFHKVRHAPNAPAVQREAAARSFGIWNGVSRFLNIVMMAGLMVYMWRTANPSDTLRFVSPAKFRG